MVSTTGTAMLGLTVGCARCHDHKFDPIPTRDYYRMLAGFAFGDRAEVPLGTRAEIDARPGPCRMGQEAEGRESDLKKWLDEPADGAGAAAPSRQDRSAPDPGRGEGPAPGQARFRGGEALAKKHEKALAVTDDEVRRPRTTRPADAERNSPADSRR